MSRWAQIRWRSNESLSILEEMRFLHQTRKDLKCDEIIRMATLNGAVALDFGGLLGRLRRGYWADMTVLQFPEELSDRHVEDNSKAPASAWRPSFRVRLPGQKPPVGSNLKLHEER